MYGNSLDGLPGCFMAMGAGIVIAIGLIYFFIKDTPQPFGQYQTQDQVEARYESCKAKAKEGFDCVMIPMLVTEDFMRETYAREAHTETSR